jgi:nitroreductase
MTSTAEVDTNTGSDLLDVLMTRQSIGNPCEPAPSDEDLDRIFDLALRAPDHGRLRPWRFVVIRGDARKTYAEFLVAALKRRDPNAPEAAAQRIRERILGVPLVIAVGAKINTDGKIPEIEQLLSTGAASMNILNAAHALGYAAKWVTGDNAYDRSVNEGLGFTGADRIVGFVFLGSKPKGPVPPSNRPSRGDLVREWTGPVS